MELFWKDSVIYRNFHFFYICVYCFCLLIISHQIFTLNLKIFKLTRKKKKSAFNKRQTNEKITRYNFFSRNQNCNFFDFKWYHRIYLVMASYDIEMNLFICDPILVAIKNFCTAQLEFLKWNSRIWTKKSNTNIELNYNFVKGFQFYNALKIIFVNCLD